MIQPKYTPILKQFNGAPVMEILRNDQPWNDDIPFAGKMHFSFGVRKARSIIHAEVTIRQYVSSMGAEPRLMDVADLGYVPDTNIRSLKVTKHGPFHNPAGILIDKNYLQLTMDDEQLSFGLTKAQAVVGLFDDIRQFVVMFG
jgi:hypothetical protein